MTLENFFFSFCSRRGTIPFVKNSLENRLGRNEGTNSISLYLTRIVEGKEINGGGIPRRAADSIRGPAAIKGHNPRPSLKNKRATTRVRPIKRKPGKLGSVRWAVNCFFLEANGTARHGYLY